MPGIKKRPAPAPGRLAKFAVWKKWNPKLVLGLKIAIIFGLFFTYAFRTLDPDFGWHLVSGSYFRHHGVPSHDIYTYTARNFTWIDHEWGNDVIVSLLYSVGGYFTLSVFFSAIWTAAIVVGGGLKTRFGIFMLAVAAVLPYSGIRPVAWTALAIVVLLKMANAKSKKIRYSIPLLFVLWANLHAGFTVGLAILVYLAIKDRKKVWLYLLLAAILASFVNPYGPRLYLEVYRTLSDREIHSQINEWFPVHMPIFSWFFAIFWAAGFGLFARRKLASWWNLSLLLLLSALSANRNLPLFVAASVKELDGYFSQAKKVLPKHLDSFRRLIICLFLGMVLAVAVLGAYTIYNSAVRSVNREAGYPVQAVAYLKAHPCDGNLFNDYDYGGYLIWKLPGKPVYIDGRMPSWRDPSGQKYLDIYLSTLKTVSKQNQQFKKYNIQCVLLGNRTTTVAMIGRLEQAHWKIAVQANDSYLLIAPQN